MVKWLVPLLMAIAIPGAAWADWPPTRWGMSRDQFIKLYPTATMYDSIAIVNQVGKMGIFCDDRDEVYCEGITFHFNEGRLARVDVPCKDTWSSCRAKLISRYRPRSAGERYCSEGNPCSKMETFADRAGNNNIIALYQKDDGLESVDLIFVALSGPEAGKGGW